MKLIKSAESFSADFLHTKKQPVVLITTDC